jgi:hypothetical protein
MATARRSVAIKTHTQTTQPSPKDVKRFIEDSPWVGDAATDPYSDLFHRVTLLA